MIRFILIFCTWVFTQQADHLLLTRVVIQPDAAESFAIYNPTDSIIDLTNYYICDDKDYYKIQTEFPNNMAPSNRIKGFTAQFPAKNIEPFDTLTVVLHANYSDYYGDSFNPDLVMYVDENNSMIETEDGSFGMPIQGDDGNPVPKLEDSGELLILFYWDNNPNNPIQDVDYFLWGNSSNAINKTDIPTYQNDTEIDSQLFFIELDAQFQNLYPFYPNSHPGQLHYSYSRIGIEETGEIDSVGNGITNHDETSENFRQSWEIASLFNLGCTDENAANFDPHAIKDDGTCVQLTIDQIYDVHKDDITYPCNEELDENDNIIITMGLIVDYADKSPSGPRIITLEDNKGNRLDAVAWEWDPMLFESVFPFVDYYDPTEYLVIVRGLLGVYNCNFQLEIASKIDIIYYDSFHPLGDFIQDSSIVSASIDPAPFVLLPTLDERLDFSYSFPKNSRVIIRVFDISGRFITSIVDQYFDLAGEVNRLEDQSEWDGRDHLGQIVAPGTYIMHIEAMNPITGETQTDAAPVVVGVKN